MKRALEHEETVSLLFWQRWPCALARAFPLLGTAAADGRYILSFPGIAAILPIILFLFGAFCGATHFFVEQPLYMSVIPIVAFFVFISFLSGGLGLIAIFGYIAGYLLLFDHLVLIRDIYHGQILREYGFWVYAGIFFNLVIFTFLPIVPIMARTLAVKAANQIFGSTRDTRQALYFLVLAVTNAAMVTLFMLVWIQMVTLGAFSYYLWWDRLYDVWDFEQFINASILGAHPLLWAAWAGMMVRIGFEVTVLALPTKTSPADITLPPSFKIYQKIPLTLKSLLAAAFMFLVLQGYIADTPSLWAYLIAGLAILFLARDGIEVGLHRWFSFLERVPLAYRLIGLFMIMGFLVHHLTEYLADNIYTRTPEPHVIVLAITLCLPIAFLLISKNEPHKDAPPPGAPFWLKPFMKVMAFLKVPQRLRKPAIKAAPFLFLAALLTASASALAHHCFNGCDSCDYFTMLFNYLAGGSAGTMAGMAGGGSGGRGDSPPVTINTRTTSLTGTGNSRDGGTTVHADREDLAEQEERDDSDTDGGGGGGGNNHPSGLTKEEWEAELKRLEEYEKGGVQSTLGPFDFLSVAAAAARSAGIAVGTAAYNRFINTYYKSYIKRNKDRLISEGNKPDRNGLTKSGRALQKHGDREGSKFEKTSGSANNKNESGQNQLKEILDSDNQNFRYNKDKGYLDVFDQNTGRGARFDQNNNFITFLD